MPLPIFSKVGVPSVTLSQAPVYPSAPTKLLNRFVGVSDAKTVQVATVGNPLGTLSLSFQQLTATDGANLLAFFSHSAVNYGAETFQYTDEVGVTYNVKYLEPQWAAPEGSYDNVSFDIVLTEV